MEEKDLHSLRERIDAIDEMIVGLLNRRMECALAIGELKRLKVRRFLDPARESEVLKRVEGINKGPIDTRSLHSVYREIVAASRSLQEGTAGGVEPLASKVCVAVSKKTMEDAVLEARTWTERGFMVEWRADFTKKPDPAAFVEGVEGPHLVTLRSKNEGGNFAGPVKDAVGFVAEAINAGAFFVDVEAALGHEAASVLIKKKRKSKVVLSRHFHRSTPPWETLRAQALEMASWGPDAVKIAATVKAPEDNLALLSLIPLLREKGRDAVIVGMGLAGRLSRIAGPLMGGLFTFASPAAGEETGPGQIPADELLKVLKALY